MNESTEENLNQAINWLQETGGSIQEFKLIEEGYMINTQSLRVGGGSTAHFVCIMEAPPKSPNPYVNRDQGYPTKS